MPVTEVSVRQAKAKGLTLWVSLCVEGQVINAVVDTGVEVTIISQDLLLRILPGTNLSDL